MRGFVRGERSGRVAGLGMQAEDCGEGEGLVSVDFSVCRMVG